MRVSELGDKIEFLAQRGAKGGVDTVGEIFGGPRPGQVLQMLLRGFSRRHRLVRILVFQLVERKADAAGKAHGLCDRFGEVAEQSRHLLRRFEIALRIGFKLFADRIDRRFLANAGEHVLQRAARGVMIQHLVGRKQRHMSSQSEARKLLEAPPVITAIEQACGKPYALGTALLQTLQDF